MTEPLSDIARDMLVFIRDHLGYTSFEIAKMLSIDDAVVRNAIAELLHRRLVIRHMKASDISSEKIKGFAAYYPA